MEALIYLANLLYLASYLTRDMLRLRVLTVIAASCLIVYFAALPEPLMTVIGWNLFFIALNLVQLTRDLVQRWRCRNAELALDGCVAA